MNITKITSILDFDAHKFVGFVDEITNIIADKVVQRIQEEERKPKLYSVEDVCDILHISKATLWRYEKAGIITPCIVGGSKLYEEKTIQDVITKGKR